MVNRCIVTRCRSGYNESQKAKARQENSNHGVKVQLHKFPDDKAREDLWKFSLKLGPKNNLQVCEKHFLLLYNGMKRSANV